MRPVMLTMEAFGSYGNRTAIDFSELNQNLFLVTGDTGAGKTTIFDAIVFALYGEASSENNKKTGQELQSHYARAGVKPFVELTFEDGYGEEKLSYMIQRTPKYLKPKKRGSGFKEENASVSLILPDGTEYSGNISETNKKIESVIGLTKEQFMKVGMIAQGEFMEMLRAKSQNKKEIFRKLFNTELFKRIVDELADRCKQKKSEVEQLQIICRTEVNHILVPEDYDGREVLKGLIADINKGNGSFALNMESLISELAQLCSYLKKIHAQCEKDYENAKKGRDQAIKDYTQGQNLENSYRQLNQAKKILEKCKEEEERIKEDNSLIEKINSAYSIKAKYDFYVDAKKNKDHTKEELSAQKEKLPQLEADFARLTEKENEAGEEKEQKMKLYTKVKERVDRSLKNLDEISLAKKQVTKAETAVSSGLKAEREAKEKLSQFERQEQEWKQEALKLAKVPADQERQTAKEKAYKDFVKEAGEVSDREKKITAAKTQADKALALYESAKKDALKANEEFLKKQTAYFDAQAGIIAREKLTPGQPCPVCGSLHHPDPHKLSEEDKDLTQAMINKLQKKADSLRKDMEEASKDCAAKQSTLKEVTGQFKEGLENLRERAAENGLAASEDSDLSSLIREARSWYNVLKADKETIAKQLLAYHEVHKNLESADQKRENLREIYEKEHKKSTEANTALEKVKERLATLEKAKDFATAKEAKEALHEADTAFIKADLVYKEAVKAAKAAKTGKEKSQTLIAKYTNDLPVLTKTETDRKNVYEAFMTEKDLSEYEWKSITEKHDPAEVSGLQKRIEKHMKEKAGAAGQYRTAKEAIGDQACPDLYALEEKRKQADLRYTNTKKKLDVIKGDYESDVHAYDALAPKMEERSKISEEYSRLLLLNKRLDGKLTGSRMDIETFVQRYYLRRILDAANERFYHMSGGQYELRMVDLEKAGDGSNKGLDLMVYSNVTQSEREIRTLSGGESFMAALALALGIADQIQENSSAISLDVMFIDEGFGSLDDHSRNQAVKVLQQMAESTKMIGIISHVTELKQEIDNQMIITKDEDGSHFRWQIN